MKLLRFASIVFASAVFVSALAIAGCGKDKSDNKAPEGDQVAAKKGVKPLVPGAGYHAETAGTAPRSENAITSDPSTGDESDDEPDVDPPPRRDPEPDRAEPAEKKAKPEKNKASSGGKQSTSVERASGDLELNDIAIAPDVVERVPQDVRRRYSEAPEVFWCWTNFSNTGEETKVTHVWRHENKVRSKIEVTVGSGKRWRSWSRHKPNDKRGEWSCEILDPDGKRLGRAAVTIGG